MTFHTDTWQPVLPETDQLGDNQLATHFVCWAIGASLLLLPMLGTVWPNTGASKPRGNDAFCVIGNVGGS